MMGEATRDESTAIAQRLLAVGELYARRAEELSESLCGAAIPRMRRPRRLRRRRTSARAVGQIHYGRTLRERLPEVAKVFAQGVIDFRVVSTIIARTENVADEMMADLDAAIARHADKWMKLSGPEVAGSGGSVGGQIRPGRGAGAAED